MGVRLSSNSALHPLNAIIYHPPHVTCCSEFPRFLPQRVTTIPWYRSYDRPDNLSTRRGTSNYLPSLLSLFLILKVFRGLHWSPVLAQLAPETTFIPSQLAGLKIAIYRNKIQYKELDTKQLCNKTRTLTHDSITGYQVSIVLLTRSLDLFSTLRIYKSSPSSPPRPPPRCHAPWGQITLVPVPRLAWYRVSEGNYHVQAILFSSIRLRKPQTLPPLVADPDSVPTQTPDHSGPRHLSVPREVT